MITEYNRPKTITDALILLDRKNPKTMPLGGGTVLSRHTSENTAVVDLQLLGLDQIVVAGSMVEIGATARLQQLVESPLIPEPMKSALRNEAGQNQRNQATIAGTIVSCDGRSAFVTGLLAMSADLVWLPGDREMNLGDYLALREGKQLGGLIRCIRIPTNGQMLLEIVSRSPMDRPILCASVCIWPSGRTRVALGGHGRSPMMVMDGPGAAGGEAAARSAYLNAQDAWASAEYRSTLAGELVRRMINSQVRL